MDAEEAWLASESCVGSDCRLALTPVEDRTAVVAAIAALDYVWHAADAGRLAWIERSGESIVLRTGSVDRERGLTVDPTEVEIIDVTKVQLWDESGFILGGDRAYALGADGRRTWTAEGLLLDAAPTVVTLENPDGGWSVVDRTNGTPIMESSPSDGVVLVSRERVDAPVSSVAPDGYRYTVSLAPLSDDGAESLTPGPVRLPVGFGDGTEYRLLRNSIGDRFTFDLVRPPSEQ